MTEYQISLWISQSLAGELSEQQRTELQAALDRSPASRAYAEWSTRIQAAVMQGDVLHGDPDMEVVQESSSSESSETLSAFSKERMRRAVRGAQVEYQNENSEQQCQFVAQSPVAYSHSRVIESANDSTSPDDHTLPNPSSQHAQEALFSRGRLLRERMNYQLSSLAAAGGAITETEIGRLLRVEVAAMDIQEDVWLIGREGRVLFSSLAATSDELGSFGEALAAGNDVLRLSSSSDEVFLRELGIWVARITCPAQLGALRLVLRS